MAEKKHRRAVDGVLLLDKPLEISSNHALQKARRLFNAAKAGHTGTLDPLATGLLPLCFGEATKFSNMMLNADKTYLARVQLGVTTTTGDSEGTVIERMPVEVSLSQLETVLADFVGQIEQLPPMHSALKLDGKPLYEYARAGRSVARKSRQVTIFSLQCESFEQSRFTLRVRCSKGTYIRTLAEDIGAALGCGAHLIGLRRTAIAHLSLDQSWSFDQLSDRSLEELDDCLLPVDYLLPSLPEIRLDAVQLQRLGQGQRLRLEQSDCSGQVRLYGDQGFVGLGEMQGHRLAPVRLLSSVARMAAQKP